MSDQAAANTDRELWREGGGDGNGMSYYEPSIHVTERGGIGINVGGTVFVKTLREWHALAAESETFPTENVNSGEDGGGGNRTRATFPTESRDFQAKVHLAGVDFEVVNGFLFARGNGDWGTWNSEPLEQAIPTLQALLGAAKRLTGDWCSICDQPGPVGCERCDE